LASCVREKDLSDVAGGKKVVSQKRKRHSRGREKDLGETPKGCSTGSGLPKGNGAHREEQTPLDFSEADKTAEVLRRRIGVGLGG